MEPAGVVGIFNAWNSSAGSIAIKVAPAIAAGCTVVIKPSEMSAMQTEVLMDAFHEAGLPSWRHQCRDGPRRGRRDGVNEKSRHSENRFHRFRRRSENWSPRTLWTQ